MDCDNKELVELNLISASLNMGALNVYECEKGNAQLRVEYLKAVGLQDACTLDNILVSVGSTAALNATIRMVAELPNSEVMLVAPCWSMYGLICSNIGVAFSYCMLRDKISWKHTFADIEEALKPSVGTVIIANPGNPTGEVFSDEVLEKIYVLCKKRGALMIIDEAYWGISDGKSIFSNMHIGDENVIIIRSLSKAFCMAGLRVGFVLAESKIVDRISQNLKMMHLVCPSVCQEIALIELKNKIIRKFNYNYIIDNYNKFRQLGHKYDCVHIVRPEAGFFVTFSFGNSEYISLEELSRKAGVIFRDGNGFNMKGYFRANLSVSREVIEETVKRLSKYLDERKEKVMKSFLMR